MLRRKEDMKEWQAEALPKEIKGQKAPEGIPTDDLPDVPVEAIPEVKPKAEEKKPVMKKKAPAKKKIEKIEVTEG